MNKPPRRALCDSPCNGHSTLLRGPAEQSEDGKKIRRELVHSILINSIAEADRGGQQRNARQPWQTMPSSSTPVHPV